MDIVLACGYCVRPVFRLHSSRNQTFLELVFKDSHIVSCSINDEPLRVNNLCDLKRGHTAVNG